MAPLNKKVREVQRVATCKQKESKVCLLSSLMGGGIGFRGVLPFFFGLLSEPSSSPVCFFFLGSAFCFFNVLKKSRQD